MSTLKVVGGTNNGLTERASLGSKFRMVFLIVLDLILGFILCPFVTTFAFATYKLDEVLGTIMKDQIDDVDDHNTKDVTFEDKIICWYLILTVIMVTKSGKT